MCVHGVVTECVQECLDLEKKVSVLNADNDVVKGEVTELTKKNLELTERVNQLKLVNEANFMKLTEQNALIEN